MARITEVELNGKVYPMSFSLLASKQIAKKYGSIQNLNKIITSSNANEEQEITEELLDLVSYLLALLIAQGCAYKNMFENDLPVPENAPVVDGKWIPLTQEQIEILMQLDEDELSLMMAKIDECISGGKTKEVSAKAKGKNAEAKRG